MDAATLRAEHRDRLPRDVAAVVRRPNNRTAFRCTKMCGETNTQSVPTRTLAAQSGENG